MALKVFYAWQSDRPSNVNRGLIRGALEAAVKKVKADPDIREPEEREIEIDHDTKGVSGSPHIAETIFRKIAACDVFVADLTLVSAKRARRPTPNPNVLIEYGYAFRTLGENRIITICNEAFGPVEKLPFDVRGRGCIKYSATAGSDKAPVRKQIASMLVAQFKQGLCQSKKSSSEFSRNEEA